MDTSENIMLRVFGASRRQQVKDAICVVLAFIRQMFPDWREAPEEDLRAWLLWHWCQGLVAAVTDAQTGEMVAVVVVRLFDEPAGFETAYLHNPNGRICYVELAIAEDKEALLAGIEFLAQRHQSPVQLVFERGVRKLAPKVYLWKRFSQLLENKAYVES